MDTLKTIDWNAWYSSIDIDKDTCLYNQSMEMYRINEINTSALVISMNNHPIRSCSLLIARV